MSLTVVPNVSSERHSFPEVSLTEGLLLETARLRHILRPFPKGEMESLKALSNWECLRYSIRKVVSSNWRPSLRHSWSGGVLRTHLSSQGGDSPKWWP